MTSTRQLNEAVREAVSDGVARAIGAIGMMGIALIHLLDLPDTISATAYIGVMYIGLIVGSIVVAAELIRTGASRAWVAGALLAGGAIAGYTVSRTVGLPMSTDDIGNWGQPLGIASLFVEGSLVALSALALSLRGTFAHLAKRARPALAFAS